MDFTGPPLHSPDPYDWMGYVDNLFETDDRNWQYARCIHDTLIAFAKYGGWERLLLLKVRRDPLNDRRGRYLVRDPRLEGTLILLGNSPHMWVKHNGAKPFYRLDETYEVIEASICRPWDVPNIAIKAPSLIWSYFRRITADAVNYGWVKKVG